MMGPPADIEDAVEPRERSHTSSTPRVHNDVVECKEGVRVGGALGLDDRAKPESVFDNRSSRDHLGQPRFQVTLRDRGEKAEPAEVDAKHRRTRPHHQSASAQERPITTKGDHQTCGLGHHVELPPRVTPGVFLYGNLYSLSVTPSTKSVDNAQHFRRLITIHDPESAERPLEVRSNRHVTRVPVRLHDLPAPERVERCQPGRVRSR